MAETDARTGIPSGLNHRGRPFDSGRFRSAVLVKVTKRQMGTSFDTAQDLVGKLRGLHEQATKERSHYYVGSLCLEAIDEIEGLRSALEHAIDHVTPDEDCAECAEILKRLGRV